MAKQYAVTLTSSATSSGSSQKTQAFLPSGSQSYATNVLVINDGPSDVFFEVGTTSITATTSAGFPLKSAESLSIPLSVMSVSPTDRQALAAVSVMVSASSTTNACSVRVLATSF